MLQSIYSMRFVNLEDYAIYKQKFEEKHGRLYKKTEKRAIVESICWYNIEDEKWSCNLYAYYKSNKIPMPLFMEHHSPYGKNGETHQYLINDYVISEEGYDIGYITEDGERIK